MSKNSKWKSKDIVLHDQTTLEELLDLLPQTLRPESGQTATATFRNEIPYIEELSANLPLATARQPFEDKAEVEQPRRGEVLEKRSGNSLTVGVVSSAPPHAQAGPLQLSSAPVMTKLKEVSPLEAARYYVDCMMPIPPSAPQFWMSPCLVSNELYYYFVSHDPYWLTTNNDVDHSYLKHWFDGRPRDDQWRLPVVNISVRAATAFAAWLSQLTSNRVRLPTLKEWQIAASARRPGWFKEEIDAGRVNYFCTAGHLHSIDAFKPNPYGIRDLLGQAYDMCFMDDHLSKPAIVGGCHYQTEAQLRASLGGEEIKSDRICPPLASFRCVRRS